VNKALKASFDISGTPPTAYRLSSDGRKWLHDCLLRHILTQKLALAANPDGTGITISVERLVREMALSRRTVFRLLDDLVALGFVTNGKQSFNGTKARTLNIDAIKRAATRVPDSPSGVPDSGECQIQRVPDTPVSTASECHIRNTPVPHTQAGQAETCVSGTLPYPYRPPNRQPYRENPGGGLPAGWLDNPAFEGMGQPTGKQEKEIEKLVAQHGWEKFPLAVEKWKVARRGIRGLEQCWRFFLEENAKYDYFAQIAKVENEESRLQEIRDRSEALAVLENRWMHGPNRFHIDKGFEVSSEESVVIDRLAALNFRFEKVDSETMRVYGCLFDRFLGWQKEKEKEKESEPLELDF
jgi:hypothetical protein